MAINPPVFGIDHPFAGPLGIFNYAKVAMHVYFYNKDRAPFTLYQYYIIIWDVTYNYLLFNKLTLSPKAFISFASKRFQQC